MRTFTIENLDGTTTEYVEIPIEGGVMQMFKETYDAQQAAQAQPQGTLD